MTIESLFEKNNIIYEVIKKGKGSCIYKLSGSNLYVDINDNNIFKMQRSTFNLLTGDNSNYVLMLIDTKSKKYYYIEFPEKNNWLSSSFHCCDKSELFLGKQVLNCQMAMPQIITKLKKYSK